MITLLVDEAYAFDYLSILEVKKQFNKDSDNYYSCLEHIREQVGEKLFDEIIQSPQYNDLVRTNKIVFDFVEQIRNGKSIDAKEVDDANMARYMYKKELQSKFFHNTLTEKKSTSS